VPSVATGLVIVTIGGKAAGKAPLNAAAKATGKAAADPSRPPVMPTGIEPPPPQDVVPRAELTRLEDPAKSLGQAIAALEAANTASHTELDWVAQQGALGDTRRLVEHHSEVRGESGRRRRR
jgi:hypothetical protein